MANYILNKNTTIKIVCEEQLIHSLKKELSDYYQFVPYSQYYDFVIYVFAEDKKYKTVSKKMTVGINNKDIKCFKDRNSILMLDNKKKEIITFYEKLNDNVVQFTGEIIVSLFCIRLEENNYTFLHSACVEKNGKAIAIIGDRGSGKTTILNALLQQNFNFICNSHLGIKNIGKGIVVEGTPTRMGVRISTLEKILRPEIKKKIMLNTEFKARFGDCTNIDLKPYLTRKFNIKLNEIKDIYNVQLIKECELKLIIVPIYMEELSKIKTRELYGIDKNEILLKNKRNGIYDTVKYLKFINDNQSTNTLPSNLDNIKMIKIYQNEKTINELINLIYVKTRG